MSAYNKGMERRGNIIKTITAVALALTAGFLIAAATLCIVFPNKYVSELNAAADEFGLDRTLVRAVVWTESRFDARAVSDKGAVGLMQIMPDTLDECAAALGIRDADGYDPVTSLRCGCYYLALMSDRFGSERAALMAYNAGEVNARKFLDGAELFPETAGYLKKVSIAKRVYGMFDR